MTVRRDPFAPVVADRLAARMAAEALVGVGPHAIPVAGAAAPVTRYSDGRERLNLGSNNVLGLTTDPRVVAGARAALEQYGTGLSGSRLLNATSELVLSLEAELADFYGTQAAVVLPSGFTANLALLSAAGAPGDAVLVDAHAHASLQAGAAASRARLVRWRHNDVADLRRRLALMEPHAGALVVVDGVYSMGGEASPLVDVVAACREHGARLVVDEAHGLGVLGERGRGAAEALGVLPDVDAVMVTMSKALGSTGGAVLTSAAVAAGLRTAVPYMFSTASVPAAVGAALAALRVLRAEPERAGRVRDRAQLLRRQLALAGVAVDPGVGAVLAVPVGSEDETCGAWRRAFELGVYTNAAVHPAVPRERGILRLTVMATHTDEQLHAAAQVLARALGPRGTTGALPVQRSTVPVAAAD